MNNDMNFKNLCLKFYEHEPESAEFNFYYGRILEDIMLFSRPEQVDKVDNHFCDLLCSITEVEQEVGFSQGFRCATQLMSECLHAREPLMREIIDTYEEQCPEATAEHDRLKALYTTKKGAL